LVFDERVDGEELRDLMKGAIGKIKSIITPVEIEEEELSDDD
jgi:hypothetical protein